MVLAIEDDQYSEDETENEDEVNALQRTNYNAKSSFKPRAIAHNPSFLTDVTCHNCGRNGHYKRDCPQLAAEASSQPSGAPRRPMGPTTRPPLPPAAPKVQTIVKFTPAQLRAKKKRSAYDKKGNKVHAIDADVEGTSDEFVIGEDEDYEEGVIEVDEEDEDDEEKDDEEEDDNSRSNHNQAN